MLDREELLRAVRPAALIAHESANIVKLQVGGDGEAGITVSANAEVGDHVGQVEAAVEGDGTTIAFNARYLADVLTNVDAEQFALELNGPLSPGVFKPVGDDQLRPRRHARPDDLLADDRRADRRRPDRGDPARLDQPARPPGLRRARGRLRARAAARSGARTPRARPASSRRSCCWPGAGRTGRLDRRRADPLGRDLARVEGAPRRRTPSRSRSSGPGPTAAPGASGSGSTASAGGAGSLDGPLRVVVFAPEEMLLVAGSPGLRRAALDQLASATTPGLRRRRSRRTAGPSSSATACCGRSARRPRRATSCASGTGPSSTPAARIVEPTGCGCWTASPRRSPAAHAEIAPDEAAAAALGVRYATNAPAAPGETPRDALARRLVETAEKEVWNGATLIGPHRDDLVVRARRARPGRLRLARPAAHGDPRRSSSPSWTC